MIYNVLPTLRKIVDTLPVEFGRLLVKEVLEPALEIVVIFELSPVKEVAQRPE